MEKPLPVSTVITILAEDYSTASWTSYGGPYLQTQQTILESHQYIPGAQQTLLQTQHGIIETQQKFMEKEHRVTAEYPAISKLYPHNSGYVATWLGGHRAEWVDIISAEAANSNARVASHADVLRGSSRVPAPLG